MSRHLSPSLLRSVAVLALALAPVAAGCKSDDEGDEHGNGDHDHDEEVGDPTGATCPQDGGMLTYEEFGKPFMEEYCVRCHSSQLTGAARNGAPTGHDFDSLAGILLVADHIDEKAASGPDATNTMMPPDGAKPTMAEREMLGQWLACEQ